MESVSPSYLWHSLIESRTNIWAATWQNQQNDCAPSEDSDQPGHPPSLIRDFAVRMKKAWVRSYPLSAQRRLRSDWAFHSEDSDQTGRMPILIWVFAGRTVTLMVMSCRGSFVFYLFLLFIMHVVQGCKYHDAASVYWIYGPYDLPLAIVTNRLFFICHFNYHS